MIDQAERLRQIVNNLKLRQAEETNKSSIINLKNKSARVITVTSGKGGVGKTNITVNLAIALSELGKRVTVLDADFGLANIDVLMGVMPKHTLVDVIYNNKSILEVLADGPKNIKYISGGSGVEELVKLDKESLERFVGNIGLLDRLSDVILIDTGAGISENVMSFVMAADEVILVTTPEPTSITDAYALIKMVAKRDNKKTIKVIVNRAEDIDEAKDIIHKLSTVAQKFLTIRLDSLGFLLNDQMVIKAVKMQQPFSISFPKSQAAKHIMDISKKLITVNVQDAGENLGIKTFVQRLVTFLGG